MRRVGGACVTASAHSRHVKVTLMYCFRTCEHSRPGGYAVQQKVLLSSDRVVPAALPQDLCFEHPIHSDDRGWFTASYASSISI